MDRRRPSRSSFSAGLFCHSSIGCIIGASRKGSLLTPIFEEVAATGSTNADVLERAAQGAPEGLWLRADRQDSGRGRMGRTWDSRSGNLLVSTIVRLCARDPAPSTLAFVTALAVFDTIKAVAPEIAVQIKWPNDILSAGGSKLCGVLLERSGDAVIVGIGLNLAWHPIGLDRPVTDLTALGALPPHPQAVTEILADAFAIWLERWRNGGMSAIAASWQKVAHPLCTAISVNLPTGDSADGLFAGLDDDGALLLRLADGEIRAIHAADIFLI